MIPDDVDILGSGLVWAAIAIALVGLAAAPKNWAPKLQTTSALAFTGALVRLAWAFAHQDWRLSYVVENARGDTNLFLRLSGLWAGAEGSLLVWTTMTAWVGVIAIRQTALIDPLHTVAALRLSAGLTALYGLVVAVTASPFWYLPIPPVNGVGLQPVLEYPAMVWHPPILYAGLVGLLIPAIVTGGGVLSRSPTPQVCPTTTLRVVTALLTLGLTTGSLWANVELGWGGFWAWDPVENAGLVAWLAAIAAIHGVRPGVTATRRFVVLALAPGVAALWATTLTRIGVIESVHAFADRPGLRIGLLVAVGAASLMAIVIVAKAPTAAKPPTVVPIAVEVGLLGGDDDVKPTQHQESMTDNATKTGRADAVAVVAAAALFVALGTYQPLIEAATSGDQVVIAGYFFTRALWPLVLAGAVLILRADRAWRTASLGVIVGTVLTPITAGPFAAILGAAGGAVAGSALRRGRLTGSVAHLGLGLLIIGTAGTVGSTSVIVHAPTDVEVEAGNVTIAHRSIELTNEPGRSVALATVDVDGTTFTPSLVSYPLRGASSSEIDRRYQGLDEVQVVLADGDADSARYRVNHLPRLVLVWVGAALITIGLLFPSRPRSSTSDRSSTNDRSSGNDVDSTYKHGSVRD